MRRLLSSNSWWLVCHILLSYLPWTQSQLALSLNIDGRALTFTRTSLDSFHACLCKSFIEGCTVSVAYNYRQLKYEASTSFPSGNKSQTMHTAASKFVCEAKFKRGSFRWINCRPASRDTRQYTCQKGNECRFYFPRNYSGVCHEKCFSIRWTNPELIKVVIENNKLTQYGMCDADNMAESTSSRGETENTGDKTSGSTQTPLKETFEGTNTETGVGIFILFPVVLCAITIIIITCLLFLRRRNGALFKKVCGHLDFTRVGICNTTDLKVDSFIIIDGNESVAEESSCLTLEPRPQEKCLQNQYEECEADIHENSKKTNQKPNLSTRKSTAQLSEEHAGEFTIYTENSSVAVLFNAYSDLEESLNTCDAPGGLQVPFSSSPSHLDLLSTKTRVGDLLSTATYEEILFTNNETTIKNKSLTQFSTATYDEIPPVIKYTSVTGRPQEHLATTTFDNISVAYIDTASTTNIYETYVPGNDITDIGTNIIQENLITKIGKPKYENYPLFSENKTCEEQKSKTVNTLAADGTETRTSEQKLFKQVSICNNEEKIVNNSHVCKKNVYAKLGKHAETLVNVYDELPVCSENLNLKTNTSFSTSGATNTRLFGPSNKIYKEKELISNISNDEIDYVNTIETPGIELSGKSEKNITKEQRYPHTEFHDNSRQGKYVEFTSHFSQSVTSPTQNISKDGPSFTRGSSVPAYTNIVTTTSVCNMYEGVSQGELDNPYVEMRNPYVGT